MRACVVIAVGGRHVLRLNHGALPVLVDVLHLFFVPSVPWLIWPTCLQGGSVTASRDRTHRELPACAAQQARRLTLLGAQSATQNRASRVGTGCTARAGMETHAISDTRA